MSDLRDLVNLDSLKQFLKEQKLVKAFSIQDKAIPLFNDNKSLHIHSMTGSGKTFSYLLPLIEKVKNLEIENGEVAEANPRAVIILPTRELASQVFHISKQISHTVKLRVRHLAGGPSKKGAIDLSRQKVDLLITSPGKYLQLLTAKKLKTTALESLVLDECDQLADMGFAKDIKKILGFINKAHIQTTLVSATTPPDFSDFKTELFPTTNFLNISGSKEHGLGHNIETFNIALKFDEKLKMCKVLLNEEAKGTGIIFMNQQGDCTKLKTFLEEEKIQKTIYLLHGELTKTERAKSLANFSEKGGLLIATDIAARGMDFQKLQWVLNYDLPFEPVYYLHRSGRVGRAGKFGKVYNFITPKDLSLSKKINEAILNQNEFNLSPLSVEGTQSVKKAAEKKKSRIKAMHTKKANARSAAEVSSAGQGRRTSPLTKSGKKIFIRKKKNHRI